MIGILLCSVLLLTAAVVNSQSNAAFHEDDKLSQLSTATWTEGTLLESARIEGMDAFTKAFFSHNGRMLAVGGEGNIQGSNIPSKKPPWTLSVWDTVTGKRLFQSQGEMAGGRWHSNVVGFSRDGKLLFVSYRTGNVNVYSTETWQPIHSIKVADFLFWYDIALSPDGYRLITNDGIKVLLRDFTSGREQDTQLPPLPYERPNTFSLLFYPTGDRIIAVTDYQHLHGPKRFRLEEDRNRGKIAIWVCRLQGEHTKSWRCVTTIEASNDFLLRPKVTADGRFLLVPDWLAPKDATQTPSAHLLEWDIYNDWNLILTSPADPITESAFNREPQEDRVVIGSTGDGTEYVWRLPDTEPLGILSAPPYPKYSFCVLSSTGLAAVSGRHLPGFHWNGNGWDPMWDEVRLYHVPPTWPDKPIHQ